MRYVLSQCSVYAQISSAVCFLLSPAASYISGATLKVDAGQSLYHSLWEIPSMWILLIYTGHIILPAVYRKVKTGVCPSRPQCLA